MALFDSDNPLAAEILQETAVAYFTACRKMVESLEMLKAFDGANTSRDAERIARRRELLEDAAERVYSVVIQRDAMKLSAYEKFFDDYEISDEVKMQMGRMRPGPKPNEP